MQRKSARYFLQLPHVIFCPTLYDLLSFIIGYSMTLTDASLGICGMVTDRIMHSMVKCLLLILTVTMI